MNWKNSFHMKIEHLEDKYFEHYNWFHYFKIIIVYKQKTPIKINRHPKNKNFRCGLLVTK